MCARVVLQLRAKGADVPVNEPSVAHEVGAPDRVKDLLSREDGAGVGHEEVEQCLFKRRKVQLQPLGGDDLAEYIDFEIPDAQPRDDAPGVPMRATEDCPRACDEVIGQERRGDVVVRTSLERVELASQIGSAGQGDDRVAVLARTRSDELDRATPLCIDVDQEEVGLPRFNDRPRLSYRLRGPPGVSRVSERQVNDIREGRIADERKNACFASLLSSCGYDARLSS